MHPASGVAGTLGTFILRLAFGDERVETGGHIRVAALAKVANNWTACQCADPADENFVAARFPDHIEGVLTMPGPRIVLLTIERGELNRDDVVEIVFGDSSQGSAGLRLGTLASQAELRLHVKPGADQDERQIEAAVCQFSILPERPERLWVGARRAIDGQSVRLRAAAFDRWGNTAIDVPSSVTAADAAGEFPPHGKALCELTVQPYAVKGACSFDVAADELELAAGSDPVDLEQQVFWGDLHAHTRLAQALETPEFLYEYAREDAGLDFVCHVEHYCAGDVNRWVGEDWRRWHTRPASVADYIADAWEYQKELVDKHYCPGRFVTLRGFEWSSNIYGHMNVLFPGADAAVIYPQSFWAAEETPLRVCEQLADQDALVIPHHTSWPIDNGPGVSGFDWSSYDQRFMRLVEICSKHGVSEYFGCPDAPHFQAAEGTVAKALARGHRLGFVGSTDTHATRPGSWGIPGDLWAARAGITAVLAEKLQRSAIYEALHARRCYATTGARIVLRFTVNGAPMGSELRCDAEAERLIEVSVVGTDAIERVELVRDGQVIARHRAATPGSRVAFSYRDHAPLDGAAYYYPRVLQVDGHQAWASPVWVEAG